MSKKLTKESKIRVLENFYSLDYVFFGKPVSELKDSCCPILSESYLITKAAALNVLIDMIKLVEHSPEKITGKILTDDIRYNAKESAKVARENATRLVSSAKGRESVKMLVKESMKIKKNKKNIDKVIQESLTKKTYSLAVDNLLLGRLVTESKKFSNLNKWEGRLIEDAYKILRDSLVESAIEVLDSIENK